MSSVNSFINYTYNKYAAVQSIYRLPNSNGEPQYPIYSGDLGDLSHVFGNIYASSIGGAGGDIYPDYAQIKAGAESIERYSSCVFNEEEQFIWATAHELGDSAIDLDTIPKVSKKELEHPNCIARLPDKSKPIRWVMGVCLTTNKKIWIPAVMCYLYIPYKTEAEQFWAAISTGCATHSSYEQAIINGACEVLERDAIALTWLQKLELPRINLDYEEKELKKYTDRQNQHIKNYFFDATNEIGIPTIYSVQKSIHNKVFSNLVMCSTELNPLTACKKLFRESASSRIPIQHKLENDAVSTNLDSFHTVFDGALYMASYKRDSAYDFLLNSKNKKNLSEINNFENDFDASENLKLIINRLKEKGHDLFVVDLTTDEAKRYGLKVVKVIIPTMMPLSFHYRTQFLGTPRLYDYPKLIGQKVKKEHELNKWPQPFA